MKASRSRKKIIEFPMNLQRLRRTGKATQLLLEGVDDHNVGIGLQMEQTFIAWCVQEVAEL